MSALRRYGSLVPMVLSAAWFGHDPSYEPAIAFLAALGIFVAPDFVALLRGSHQAKEETKEPERESLLLARPRLMVHTAPDSLEDVGVRLVRSSCGTISVWVYVHQRGSGIRELENNRYLFACATDFVGPYRNVFAFAHGPTQYSPPAKAAWKLWLANSKGDGKTWTYPDGGEFDVGWHLVLVRWDHSGPLIEMLIDGITVVSDTGYLGFWPDEYPERAYAGCWPNKSRIHWANTFLSRLRMMPYFAEARWISNELRAKPQDPKV